MLSATPVNNGFKDLKNQLQLAYEGEVEKIDSLLDTKSSIDDIFRQAQTAYNLSLIHISSICSCIFRCLISSFKTLFSSWSRILSSKSSSYVGFFFMVDKILQSYFLLNLEISRYSIKRNICHPVLLSIIRHGETQSVHTWTRSHKEMCIRDRYGS